MFDCGGGFGMTIAWTCGWCLEGVIYDVYTALLPMIIYSFAFAVWIVGQERIKNHFRGRENHDNRKN